MDVCAGPSSRSIFHYDELSKVEDDLCGFPDSEDDINDGEYK